MAREAGLYISSELRIFAALVAADERDRCAALVETLTYRARRVSGGINGQAVKPCELTAETVAPRGLLDARESGAIVSAPYSVRPCAMSSDLRALPALLP